MKKTILCIDDENAGLYIRKKMLELEGYDVVTASGGEEGLKLLQNYRVDAVIVDYRMPAMNGGEVTKRIREQWPHIPVVMLSGYPDEVPQEAIHFVDSFITKGDAPERLLAVIATNLEGRSAGRMTILNVDDNQEHRYAVTRVLRQAGFNVVEAGTGREALQMAWSRPQLVILDINLPDMMGFDVCRHLKDNFITKDIPVIHVSATYRSQYAKSESVKSGAVRFLEQPADLKELVAIVQQELHAP